MRLLDARDRDNLARTCNPTFLFDSGPTEMKQNKRLAVCDFDSVEAYVEGDYVYIQLRGHVCGCPHSAFVMRKFAPSSGIAGGQLVFQEESDTACTSRPYLIHDRFTRDKSVVVIESKSKTVEVHIADANANHLTRGEISADFLTIVESDPSDLASNRLDNLTSSAAAEFYDARQFSSREFPLAADPFTWAWVGIMLAEGAIATVGGMAFEQLLKELGVGTGEDLPQCYCRTAQEFASYVLDAIDSRVIERLSGEVSGHSAHLQDYMSFPSSPYARANLDRSQHDLEVLIGDLNSFGNKGIAAALNACAVRLSIMHEVATYVPEARAFFRNAVDRYRDLAGRAYWDLRQWHDSQYRVVVVSRHRSDVYEYGEYVKSFHDKEDAEAFAENLKQTSSRAVSFYENTLSPNAELQYAWWRLRLIAEPGTWSSLLISASNSRECLVPSPSRPSDIAIRELPDDGWEPWAIAKLEWRASWEPHSELFSIQWVGGGEWNNKYLGMGTARRNAHPLRLIDSVSAYSAWVFEMSREGGWSIRCIAWRNGYMVRSGSVLVGRIGSEPTGIRPDI